MVIDLVIFFSFFFPTNLPKQNYDHIPLKLLQIVLQVAI
jgi:hypothetical protein